MGRGRGGEALPTGGWAFGLVHLAHQPNEPLISTGTNPHPLPISLPTLSDQTLNTASLRWATALFFGYLYMVASWGGYSFIVNLLPIHCLASIVLGRVSTGLYVAYAPFAILGALAACESTRLVEGMGGRVSVVLGE